MFKTIKAKFILLSLMLIVLSVGLPLVFLLNQVSENFNERSGLMIETTIDLLIEGLNNSMMRGDEKNVQKIVEQISNNRSIDHVRIFDEQGVIKFANDSTEVGKRIDNIEPGHVRTDIKNIINRSITLDKSTNVFKAIQPIIIEERCQSCHSNKVVSYIDVDTDFTQAEVKFYTGSFHLIFLGTLLIILLALGFFYLFNKYINSPLNKFMFALGEVEKGNLEVNLPARGNDEFSVLNSHYNRMVRELKYSREKIDEMHFEQLQRMDKMVTLGELTASMAHDINNHSAIIMSRADYLLYESEMNNDLIKYKEDLDVVNNQIEKISKITRNILQHSKKLSKNFTEIDFVKLVEFSSNMIEPLIRKRKILLKKEINLSEALIKGDANQLEQMILNLVSNSADAVNNGGEIQIIVDRNSEDKVELIVKDNGIGIEKEDLDKIFSPFYTKKEFDKGTGLGLYIVNNICKNHNADIVCESEVNKGTSFKITFNGGVKND